jgi:hypothetical protein
LKKGAEDYSQAPKIGDPVIIMVDKLADSALDILVFMVFPVVKSCLLPERDLTR